MNNQRVVHVHGKVRYDVYVGRDRDPRTDLKQTYDWGNKFLIGRHTRESAILAHVAYVLERPWLVDKVREDLRRKILGCWCDPLACHANILAEVADSTPVGHVAEKHVDCRTDDCQVCDGGLSICVHCRAGEGGLTSECPKEPYDMDPVYCGERNFIVGRWVDGSVDKEGVRCMPCWGGKVHWAR